MYVISRPCSAICALAIQNALLEIMHDNIWLCLGTHNASPGVGKSDRRELQVVRM